MLLFRDRDRDLGWSRNVGKISFSQQKKTFLWLGRVFAITLQMKSEKLCILSQALYLRKFLSCGLGLGLDIETGIRTQNHQIVRPALYH